MRLFLFAAVLIPMRAFAFDPSAINGISTKGPNCYFTALTVNNLLAVPAVSISDNIAAILFLNPALCRPEKFPQSGDIGLEENMGTINHVFTYLGPNRRFEKAGPAASDLYTYANVPSNSASEFVRCQKMDEWIEAAIKAGPEYARSLDEALKKFEQLLDIRNGEKSDSTYQNLKIILDKVEGSTRITSQRLNNDLAIALKNEGVDFVPFPGMMNGDYYQFAKTHARLLADPKLFSLFWLSARLAYANEAFIYYKM